MPKSSAFGVIEVKRSNYSGVDEELEKLLADADAKKIVADPRGAAEDYKRSPGLGVVSVLEGKPSKRLQALLDADRVVAIFEKAGDTAHVRGRDVLVLVNFLHFVTWRYRVQGSAPGYMQLNTNS